MFTYIALPEYWMLEKAGQIVTSLACVQNYLPADNI